MSTHLLLRLVKGTLCYKTYLECSALANEEDSTQNDLRLQFLQPNLVKFILLFQTRQVRLITRDFHRTMSDDNSDSAPSNALRVGAAGPEEEEEVVQQSSSPSMSGSSPSSNPASGRTGSSPGGESGPAGLASDNRGPNSDDMDALSSGNDSGERESEGGLERENGSRGRQSMRSYQSSSSHNGKDSGMMMETTESNKR